jgi:hypothetical protein
MVTSTLENEMPTVCESCGRLNRTQAMFCSGCLHQLPAFAPSGASALETLRRAAESSARDDAARLSRARAVAELRFPYWLPALLLTLCAGFIGWYAVVPHARTGSLPPTPTRAVVAAPGAAPLPDAIAAASASPAQAQAQAPLWKDAQSGHAEAAPYASPSEPEPSPNESPASQTVAAFYRALSNGDGRTAVAAVTPTKRGTGAFHVDDMSRFFGSLREPLVIESVETVAPNRVLARYAYRASRAWCRTTATIETEAIGQETFIRSIKARC